MRRLRRSTKQYIVIVLLCFMIIGTAFVTAYFLILHNIEKEYGIQLESIVQEVNANQRYVYEAIEEIEAGSTLTKEVLEYKKVYSGQAENTFIQEEDIGKTVLVDIPKGVYVQKNMLAQQVIIDQVRETAFDCIQMADHIMANDTIDVRLCYPNGENYIVLSKKEIKACSEDRMEWYFWLDEEEILLMSSAIVDAYLYSGAYLYSTKYIEPTIQEESIVNYQASLATQELIHENPNIVEIASQSLNRQLRKELENRLAQSISLDVENIQWDEEAEEKKTQAYTAQEEQQGTEETVAEEYYYYSEEEEDKKKDVEYGE